MPSESQGLETVATYTTTTCICPNPFNSTNIIHLDNCISKKHKPKRPGIRDGERAWKRYFAEGGKY